MYQKLPDMVATDERGRPRGVPLKIHLHPLSKMSSTASRIARDVSKSLINRLQEVLQSFDEVQEKAVDLEDSEEPRMFSFS